MPDPGLMRLFGVPGWALLWVAALASCFLFVRRVVQIVGLLRRARPEVRWDRIPRRLVNAAWNVLGQRRMFQEPVIGAAHFLIFWSFVFFATSFWWNLARGLLPFLPVPYSDDVVWMAVPMEVTAVLALAAIVVAAVRRYIFTPQDLERTRDATIVLSLISLLLVTFLLAQGARGLAAERPSVWSPAGTVVAGALGALGVARESAAGLYLSMWYAHMAVVLGFLAYLPYSKHAHLLYSPFGVLFTSFRPGAMPAESEGASQLAEFTWRQLFNALTCAECGRCDRSCPAHASGYALSPKTLIHHFKELVGAAVAGGGATRPAAAAAGGAAPEAAPGVADVVGRDAIWACTTCGSCMARCPVFNEHLALIVELRRHLVANGAMEDRVQEVLVNLGRYGNSFGKSARARSGWTTGLGFPVKDARKEPVEYLWVVGDYASYDPRAQTVTKAAARVFQRAGLDFGILFDGEQNAGNDVRRIGEEGLFDALREKNLKALEKARFTTLVTTDPHTYHVLKHEYGGGNGGGTPKGAPVLHFAELADRLLRDGKLKVETRLDASVTYHDPCYLGRYNGVYDAPRRVLRALGARVLEMPRNRDAGYCCGAGGGRIWMEDTPGIKERPSESRLREAAAVRGAGTFVVACPKDLVMFQDALKTTGLEGSLVVKDLAELVDSASATAVRSETHASA